VNSELNEFFGVTYDCLGSLGEAFLLIQKVPLEFKMRRLPNDVFVVHLGHNVGQHPTEPQVAICRALIAYIKYVQEERRAGV
jgi:hypothetical protein